MATSKVAATNAAIINSYRSLTGDTRLPAATKNNIDDIYNQILNVSAIRNDFVDALVTQIMDIRINYAYFKNPLRILKEEPMRYGMTEEEIFVNFVQGQTFNQFAGVAELYKFYESNIMAAYHKLSPAIQYAVTISFDNLRTAFRSEYGIRDLINAKVQVVFGSANYDEYLSMRRIAESAYASGNMYAINVTPPTTTDTSRQFTILLKSLLGKMTFPQPQFTIAGSDASSSMDGLFWITTPEIDAQLDVDVLAYYFHNDRAEVNAHKIIVDKFDNADILAIVFDMRFFKVKDNFRAFTDSKNGAALTWNYFYTVSQMFSYSPFFQAVALTKGTVGVSTLTLASGLSVAKGGEVAISVTASDDDASYVPAMYDMQVSGNTSTFTKIIPGSNILVVGNDEKSTSLTVTATSRYDTTVSGTTTVTVTG